MTFFFKKTCFLKPKNPLLYAVRNLSETRPKLGRNLSETCLNSFLRKCTVRPQRLLDKCSEILMEAF